MSFCNVRLCGFIRIYLLKPVFHDLLQKKRFFTKKLKKMISRMRRSYVWKRRSYVWKRRSSPCQVFIIFFGSGCDFKASQFDSGLRNGQGTW